MSCIYNGTIIDSELSRNARGGTELLRNKLVELMPQEILQGVAIHCSRPRELYSDVKNILWCHDLPQDPEVEHLRDGGWKKYDKIAFVSNWQMQMYNSYLGVPYSHSEVVRNAISPIDNNILTKMEDDKIRLVYFSTPHRGLAILDPVFRELCKSHDNIELDVFSSFKLYGWEQRDEPFQKLFESLKSNPRVNYHGSVPNEDIRKALQKSHILAYPSIWQETSCLCLLESLSAGLVAVHPNLAALPETANSWSIMYQYHEDLNEHAKIFYAVLDNVIRNFKEVSFREKLKQRQMVQKDFIDTHYSWETRIPQWINLISSVKNSA